MKTIYMLLLVVVLSGLAGGAALAEEEAADSGPIFRPVEVLACNYRKGQDRADLDRVIEKWNAWMDESKAEPYRAWVYTAHYGSPDYAFDIAWLGAWPDGEVMGRSTDSWIQNGRAHAAAFDRVVDCNLHANFVTTQMRKTDRKPPPTSVLTFSDCKVNEESSMREVMEAIGDWNDYLVEQGSVGNEWIFFPVYGGEADYHFKWVSAHPNHTELGKDYERYANGGGYQKGQEMFAGKVKCSTSRVYNAEMVRDGAPK
ncbi:MAG: hypothetical protein HKN50_07610 [Gammaproteobacteria bacterium]|nr:hypothetical protein [Gammaproteobacteria bacterium]